MTRIFTIPAISKSNRLAASTLVLHA